MRVAIFVVVGLLAFCDASPAVKRSLAKKGDVQGREWTIEPANSAVVAGGTIALECANSVATSLTWSFVDTAGASPVTIISSCVVNPDYATRFGVANVGAGRCDVVVLAATVNDAGTYACQGVGSFDLLVSARLAVLESEPVCSVTTISTPVREGDEITAQCSVNYTDNVSPVEIMWSATKGAVVSKVSSKTVRIPGKAINTTSSTYIIVATQPSTPSYTGLTHFAPPMGLPSTATNTPAYQSSFATPVYATSYGVEAPDNTAALAGTRVELFCRRRNQNVAWTFVSAGDGTSALIAVDCTPVGSVATLYSTNSSFEACNLIVNSVSPVLAGTYTCQDTSSNENAVSAQLITLESQPVCTTDATDGLLPNAPVVFSCRVGYTGIEAPLFRWEDADGNILPSNTNSNGTHVDSRLSVLAVEPFVGPVSAITYFEAPVVDPPSHINPATNAPAFISNWTSLTYSVLPGQPLRLVNTIDNATDYGRLEVQYEGLWGTVCDDGFRAIEAGVACRQLGFTEGARILGNEFDNGFGPIWLDEVTCLGTENALSDCSHNGFGQHNCAHSEDVGIRCT
jgi:hypothetical protein